MRTEHDAALYDPEIDEVFEKKDEFRLRGFVLLRADSRYAPFLDEIRSG